MPILSEIRLRGPAPAASGPPAPARSGADASCRASTTRKTSITASFYQALAALVKQETAGLPRGYASSYGWHKAAGALRLCHLGPAAEGRSGGSLKGGQARAHAGAAEGAERRALKTQGGRRGKRREEGVR